MIREPNWRRELEEYSIRRVEQLYSHQRIAKRLIDLWQTILATKVDHKMQVQSL
jgi:hypothetical protein